MLLLGLGLGLLIGGVVGFNSGVRKIVGKVEVAAFEFLDALRDRYGTAVQRKIEVGEDEFGSPVYELAEFNELPEDLEDLGAELFDLR